jgi:hypothetical protein
MSIALVQSRSDASGTTSLAFNSNVTAGNLLVVLVCDTSGSGASGCTFTCSDSQGNSYSSLSKTSNNNGTASGQLFIAVAGSTGANTVTVSASNVLSAVAIHEFSGVFALDVSDPSAIGSGNTQTSNSVTTTYAAELIFGWEYANTNLGQASVTKGSSFTLAESSASKFLTQYKVTSSSGSYTSDTTTTTGKGGGVNWVEGIAAFNGPADATISGTGAASTTATGTPDLQIKVSGTGASSTAAGTVGTVHTDQHISGVGAESTVSGSCGALPLKGVGAESSVLAGIGTTTATAVVTGVGASSTSAGSCGTITGTANVTGVGAASTVVGTVGAPTVKVSGVGVSATGAASAGSITLKASVVGTAVVCQAGTGSVTTSQNVTGTGAAVTCSAGVGEVTCNSPFPMITFLGQ